MGAQTAKTIGTNRSGGRCCPFSDGERDVYGQTRWKSRAPHMTLRCSCFPQICEIMNERAGDWRSSSFATWIGENLKGTSLI